QLEADRLHAPDEPGAGARIAVPQFMYLAMVCLDSPADSAAVSGGLAAAAAAFGFGRGSGRSSGMVGTASSPSPLRLRAPLTRASQVPPSPAFAVEAAVAAGGSYWQSGGLGAARRFVGGASNCGGGSAGHASFVGSVSNGDAMRVEDLAVASNGDRGGGYAGRGCGDGGDGGAADGNGDGCGANGGEGDGDGNGGGGDDSPSGAASSRRLQRQESLDSRILRLVQRRAEAEAAHAARLSGGWRRGSLPPTAAIASTASAARTRSCSGGGAGGVGGGAAGRVDGGGHACRGGDSAIASVGEKEKRVRPLRTRNSFGSGGSGRGKSAGG
ncbi:unnamed protein product, partial [Phaeothamnion confervicola]